MAFSNAKIKNGRLATFTPFRFACTAWSPTQWPTETVTTWTHWLTLNGSGSAGFAVEAHTIGGFHCATGTRNPSAISIGVVPYSGEHSTIPSDSSSCKILVAIRSHTTPNARQPLLSTATQMGYTDKKENCPHICKYGNSEWSCCKVMRNGFLIYEEMRKYFPIRWGGR